MKFYIIAILISTALTAGSQSSAAEPSKDRSSAEKERSSAEKERSSAEKERRAAADAEFDQAKMLLDDWCQKLETSLALDRRNAPATLRLADCKRVNGSLAEADELIAEASARLGDRTMASAQLETDQQIGQQIGVDEPRAEAHFRVSERLWKQACTHFEASLRLDASIATQLAVSLCQIRRGELRSARALLTTTIAAILPEVESDSFRATQHELGKALLRELDRVQPMVTLRAPPGFRGAVELDGASAKVNWSVAVDPGNHTVRVTFDSGRIEIVEINARATQSLHVDVGAPRRVRSPRRRIALWSLTFGGVASAIATGGFYWSAQNQWTDLEAAKCNRASRFGGEVGCPDSGSNNMATRYNRTLAYSHATATGSVLLLAGALIFHLTTPKSGSLRIVPATNSELAGVAMFGSF